MAGRPLLGSSFERTGEEMDARATVARFSRGNVAMQEDRFVSEQDSEREFEEVAKSLTRN
jgi:hypothetical protein